MTFLQNEQLIDLNVPKGLHQAQRPSHLDQVHLFGLTQAKVQTKVILGDVAGSAHDFVDLRVPAGNYTHARANGASVRLSPNTFHLQPIVLGGAVISQKRGRLVHVDDHDVNVPIIIEVPERRSAAGTRLTQRRATVGRNVSKAPIPKVPIDNLSLLEGEVQFLCVHFREDVAV
jgi:hypothetical protein